MDPNPGNYINLSCVYNYNSESYSKEDIEVTKLDISKIFKSIVKGDQLNYFIKPISSFLIKNNIEEKAYFRLRKGRKGNGTMTTFLKNAFKNYWDELNREYYTTHKHSADELNQKFYLL